MTRLASTLLALAASGAAEVTVPPDTVTCAASGWSNDGGSSGLEVRAAPNAAALIVARFVRRMEPELAGDRVEFAIIGYRGGWLLIEGASHGDYGDPPPAHPVYAGKGWVRGSSVGGQALAGRFHAAPRADARSWSYGAEPDALTIRRVLECRGRWVRVETDRGTGWLDGMCGNQVTTCG